MADSDAPVRSHHLTIRARGVISLPVGVRERHQLDEPGAQLELIERADGVIELRPLAAIPADQKWFWSERWQKMEREAERDIAAGRVSTADGVEEFLAELDD